MFVVLMMYRSIFVRNLVASLFVGFMSGGGWGVGGRCWKMLRKLCKIFHLARVEKGDIEVAVPKG